MNKHTQYSYTKSFKVALSCVVFKKPLVVVHGLDNNISLQYDKKPSRSCTRKKSKPFSLIHNDPARFTNDHLRDKNYLTRLAC